MSLNLKSLSATDISTFQLLDANDEPLFAIDSLSGARNAVTVTVYGPGSKEFQRVQSLATNRAIARMKKKGKTDLSADERLREQAAQLAELTVRFEHLDYEGLTGRDLAHAIYMDTSIGFIADQVNKHIADWSNFTKGSQKS